MRVWVRVWVWVWVWMWVWANERVCLCLPLFLPPLPHPPSTAVLLKGMDSMPRGRREGMGPYVPSSRFKKRRCVRGVPTYRAR